jgi:hypothetical protein
MFGNMPNMKMSSGMCRLVVVVGTKVSEERVASIFRVKAINELKAL